jgi:thioredoxin-like negative regulator of GroEL
VPRLLPAIATAAGLVLVASGATVASAQQPAPQPTTTAPTAPVGPPALDSLRLPNVISAQQGHARFLVGVRLATPSKLMVQIVAGRDGKIVQTVTDAKPRQAGRAYFRVEGVDSSGFQLVPGAYTLRIQATDAQGRTSPVLQRAFKLKLTAPRGLFDAYTVPLWRAFRRQAGTTGPGQLVAVVAPKGVAATAGIRRGDVITKIAGKAVGTPGAFAVALRALPAQKAVPIELIRGGQPLAVTMEPKPDWEPVADYAKVLNVAVARDPKSIALADARARQLVDAGKIAPAQALIDAWPASWRASAPGQLLLGDLLSKQSKWKPALGAYNRARVKDPTMGAAEFGRGLALSGLGKNAPSTAAFAAAAADDPGDPAAQGFLAYALLRANRTPEAVAAAQAAVKLDPRYADGFLPLGIALLGSNDRAGGVKALRRGLILLEEPERADQLIAQHLVRADP